METAGKRFRFRTGLVVLLFIIIPHIAAIEAEWKDQIIENQRFTLKYITSYGGRQSVDIKDPQWPDGISKISGPYTAQRTVENEDGTFATVLQVIYTLRGNKPGIFTIPSLKVSDRITEQHSEVLEIPVLRKDEAFLHYPLLLEWGALPRDIYTGQAIPLILMMKNMEEISLPDSVSINTPEAALLEQVRGLGDIQYSTRGEDTIFNVPMETWMVTPSRSGTMTIGSVQVKILGLTRKSEALSIKVLELPEVVSGSGGAVGDFNYSLQVPGDSSTVDEAFVLTITVEGTGNLNYLELPEPVFPDSLTVVQKDNSDYTAMESGFQGLREIQYTLTAKKEGQYDIQIPSFSWLNPENGEVSTSSSRELSIEVLSLLETLKDNDLSYKLLSPDALAAGDTISIYKKPMAYLLFLPGILILLLSRVRKIRKSLLFISLLFSLVLMSSALPEEKNPVWITEAENYFEQEEFSSALSLYQRVSRDWQGNWVYQYNRGILHFMNKDKAEAVASLRKALYMSNSNTQVRETLDSIEESLGLENQIDLTVFLSPNIVFILFVLSVNLLLISIAWLLIKNSSLPVLFLLLFSLTVLGSGSELVRTIWLLNRKEAVVLQDVAIKKIPEVRGSSWITVKEGTSVELISDYENFTLIRSAYGLEGWILKKDLISVNGDNSDEI